ncbi:MAG: nucleotidyltransferase family protein [Opitutaceae bacterium]|nr:nucleotidyltransferase family protein [Opitutaceae bacterium]
MPEVPPPLPERFQLSPEFRLLAACSWLPPAPWDRDQSRLIAALCGNPINWTTFQNLIDRHRVPILVHANLAKYGGSSIPAEPWKSIQARARKASALSLLQAAELVRLSRVFREAGIDLLPLKGTTLSLRLYGELTVRSLRDLDLLVRTEDFDRAERLLFEQGYRRIIPDFEPTERMKTVLRSLTHHYNYVHGSRNTRVELHWRFHDWSQDQLQQLWIHSRDLQWRGTDLRHIEDGILFLLLCEHGTKHMWFRMKWLSDVAMLMIREGPQTREDLAGLVSERRLEGSVAQTLLLVHWLYGIVPPEWMRALTTQDDRAVDLASTALEAILSPREGQDPNPIRGHLRIWRYLRNQGKAPSPAAYLRGIALNPNDASLVPLPDSLFWFYYVLRPILWIWRRRRLGR